MSDGVCSVDELRRAARESADLLRALSDRLPATLPADQRIRISRALGEVDHHLAVAAYVAGLVRAGGGDAR